MKNKFEEAKVAVILGYYNGNKYITEQIKSILEQTHKNIDIYIFDDKSSESIALKSKDLDLQSLQNIKYIKREKNIGYAKNFLKGLKEVGDNYHFYAFSDQDDIWEKDKISTALTQTDLKINQHPILYFSRTAYYSSDCMKEIGSSKIFKKPTSFSNALVQNIAGGNTILMNSFARKIVIQTVDENDFISHDWWCYLLITGAGGEIIYDKKKTVKYRQHSENLIGMNIGFINQKSRLIEFASGKVKSWLDCNIENLSRHQNLLSKRNSNVLKNFSKARKSKNILKRIFYFLKSGVYRQSTIENLIFFIGCIFRKI